MICEMGSAVAQKAARTGKETTAPMADTQM